MPDLFHVPPAEQNCHSARRTYEAALEQRQTLFFSPRQPSHYRWHAAFAVQKKKHAKARQAGQGRSRKQPKQKRQQQAAGKLARYVHEMQYAAHCRQSDGTGTSTSLPGTVTLPCPLLLLLRHTRFGIFLTPTSPHHHPISHAVTDRKRRAKVQRGRFTGGMWLHTFSSVRQLRPHSKDPVTPDRSNGWTLVARPSTSRQQPWTATGPAHLPVCQPVSYPGSCPGSK